MKTPSIMLPKPSVNAKRKPKNHSRRNKTRTKRGMVIDLDKAARVEIVEIRDRNICQRCGAELGSFIYDRFVVIQWAHIHTREYYCIRWEPDNSLALCDRCHMWLDNHKVLGFDWFAKKFPERWERIVRVLQSGNNKTSDADIRAIWKERCGAARRG